MKDRQALYKQIFEDIVDKVKNGTYKPGDRIPTEKQFSEEYKVSRITSKKAMDLAAENNIITRVPGKGSFVTKEAPRNSRRSEKGAQKILGLIQPDLSEFFGLKFYREMERLAQNDGIYVMSGLSFKNIENEKELIKRFYEYGVDGFIIQPVHYETFSNEILRLILEGYPIVLIDRSLRDIACPNVISDNQGAGISGIDHLVSLGHKHIGISSRPIEAGSSLMEREKGVIEALMKHGYSLNRNHCLTDLHDLDDKQDATYEHHLDKAKDFLGNRGEMTALFALEYSPIPIIMAAAKEMEIRIPEDLSVLCFDSPGHLVGRLNPVTHIRQDEEEIARRAFGMVKSMIGGEKPEVYTQKIGTRLIPGNSCARVKN